MEVRKYGYVENEELHQMIDKIINEQSQIIQLIKDTQRLLIDYCFYNAFIDKDKLKSYVNCHCDVVTRLFNGAVDTKIKLNEIQVELSKRTKK
jgi:hypothetical protein